MVLQNRSSGSLAADGSLSYIHFMPGAPVNYYFATALWSCKVSEPRRLLQETQGPGNLDSDLGRAAGDLLGERCARRGEKHCHRIFNKADVRS
jgi:hypothetical protein